MWNIRAVEIRPSRMVTARSASAANAGVVRDEYDGLAALLKSMEGLHYKRSGGGVQVSRRLIGQDDGRVINEGACDGDALHLTAREFGYAVVPVVDGQRDGLQRVYGAHFTLATGHVSVCQRA